MPQSYEARLRRVLRHIHDHPGADQSLDALADVAAMSRFHWHKVFRAMTGATCAEAVRRVRLHRAAFRLAQDDAPLDRVAAEAGYDNVQSFGRAFRTAFGQSPQVFRETGTPSLAPLILKTGDDTMHDITVRTLPEMRLVGVTHRGPFQQIGRAYEELGAIFTARGLWPAARGMVAVYPDDPAATEPEALQSFAGIQVDPALPLPEGLAEHRQPGGRHAVLRLQGPYTGLPAAWEHLYGRWLPASGEEPAAAPPFELYPNSPQDTAPAELLTDICAPLRDQDHSTG